MTGDPSWALQQAVFSKLTGNASVTALVGQRVYDDVPENATFPYIVVGESWASPWDDSTAPGLEHIVMLHHWSRYDGAKELRQMMAAVYDALNRATLTVSGQDVLDVRFTFGQALRDPDGETRHGVQRFSIWTAEA